MATATDKCQVRGCKLRGCTEFKTCANEGCAKRVHMICYQGAILMNKNGDDLPPLPEFQVACSKGCYKTVMKAGAESNRVPWDKDGKKGQDDPHTSMKILVDWMTTEGNYSRYRGKGNNGVTKLQFATQSAEKMARETMSTERNAKQVMDKISWIEDSFRSAHEFATSQTGAGIQERDGEATFQDAVRRKCSMYYELVDIMVDRASTEPKATKYDPSTLDEFSDGEEKERDQQDSDANLSVEDDHDVLPPVVDVPASASASVASSRNKSKKTTRKRSSPLMDDETIEEL
jgi:hypothetical protein